MKSILTSAGAVAAVLVLSACQPAPDSAHRDKAQATDERGPATVPSTAAVIDDDAEPRLDREPQLIEPSKDLGGILPLQHGFFVSGGANCEDPPNAALRRYDGVGLSGAHTRDCQIKVLNAKGQTYLIEQTCTDAGEGPAPRSYEQSTVAIENNLKFKLERAGATETFRYCPASRLPPGIGD